MFNGITTSLVPLESKISDPTIHWTELLVARDPPSASATFFAIFLLSFAHVASLLATLLYSAADKAPLNSAVVRFHICLLLSPVSRPLVFRTPLRYFDTARSMGYTFKSNFFQVGNVLTLVSSLILYSSTSQVASRAFTTSQKARPLRPVFFSSYMGNHFGHRYKISFAYNGPPTPKIKLDLV